MANSPGVMSLNSVGTISPATTPAPTPTPADIRALGMESCSIVIDTGQDPVIEELRTIRPEDVSLLQQMEASTDSQDTAGFPPPQPGTAKKSLHISPSQNFLSNFPVVSKQSEQTDLDSSKTIQRDIYQALKELDTELALGSPQPEPEKQQKSIKPEQTSESKKSSGEKEVVRSAAVTAARDPAVSCSLVSTAAPRPQPNLPTSSSSAALSVYDFSSAKPETPPPPLQKARSRAAEAKLGVKAGTKTVEEPAVAVKQSGQVREQQEKKIYTEMQNKSKKTPEEAAKSKYPDRKGVGTDGATLTAQVRRAGGQ